MIELAPERIDEKNCWGYTSLHIATYNGREAAVSLLLSAKADANKTNSSGETPLRCAYGERLKQLLIDAGGR